MASPDVQRKLTAILCADVVGYSRLMGENEKATVRTLTEYRQVFSDYIERFGGRVVDAKGDTILAEFASVVDAVEGAAEIQRELAERNTERVEERKMLFRIGVNHGDVMVRGEELYGDAVNIAARLESLAEPGGICVSRPVYDQVKQKLKVHFEYMGEQQVKNIAEPVRAYQVLAKPGDGAHRLAKVEQAVSEQTAALELPDKPSIAVLAFDNMSDDPDQEHFSDGISEDIITDLSGLSGLFVISRKSSFSYKRKLVPVQQIGRDLGVRYLLEGSVRRAENRVRVTAQLVDAKSGNHLWAERFDRDLKDLFVLQDEITSEIVTALDVKLVSGEQARYWRKSLKNPKARDLYYQGRDIYNRKTKDANGEARLLFEEVIRLEPGSAIGYTYAGWTHYQDTRTGWSKDPAHSLNQTLKMARKAIALDETNGFAHALMGNFHLLNGQLEKAIAEGERAVALSPSSAAVVTQAAVILHFSSRSEEAIAMANRAIRLRPGFSSGSFLVLGSALRSLGRYNEAIVPLQEVVARNPQFLDARLSLAAAYSAMGKKGKANEQAREIQKLNPRFSVTKYISNLPLKDKKLYGDALRQAGLPE